MCYSPQSRELSFSFPPWHYCSTFSKTSASTHYLSRCIQPPQLLSHPHRLRSESMNQRERPTIAFKRDNRCADVHFFETGPFALETHVQEIANAISDFRGRKLDGVDGRNK